MNLDKVAATFADREAARADLQKAEEAFSVAVREAMTGGATAPQIAKLTGLTPPRIYQIRDGRR
ncbi:hypothetical protein [Arthrobacter sp. RCC_34]|uniref:hypothetical protein n=1 Tax=Arthrobacter sp. RCC_34 TaxID=3239230 RepID=UPI0035249ACC